jgi:hypothetical protein
MQEVKRHNKPPFMKKVLTVFMLVLISLNAYAQDLLDDTDRSKGNLGFGLGVSYGGIGARLSYLPVSQVALFGAGGYNFNGFGYNVGAQFRLSTSKKAVPYAIAMYGYNGVIVVRGLEYSNKTFYGMTAGGGVEIHQMNGQNFFTIELLYPFRSQEFWDSVEMLKNDPNIEMTGPLPVAFSFGYHIKF